MKKRTKTLLGGILLPAMLLLPTVAGAAQPTEKDFLYTLPDINEMRVTGQFSSSGVVQQDLLTAIRFHEAYTPFEKATINQVEKTYRYKGQTTDFKKDDKELRDFVKENYRLSDVYYGELQKEYKTSKSSTKTLSKSILRFHKTSSDYRAKIHVPLLQNERNKNYLKGVKRTANAHIRYNISTLKTLNTYSHRLEKLPSYKLKTETDKTTFLRELRAAKSITETAGYQLIAYEPDIQNPKIVTATWKHLNDLTALEASFSKSKKLDARLFQKYLDSRKALSNEFKTFKVVR